MVEDLTFDLADIDTVITDGSTGNIIKTVDQVGNGSLSRTGSAYESYLLPGSAYSVML